MRRICPTRLPDRPPRGRARRPLLAPLRSYAVAYVVLAVALGAAAAVTGYVGSAVRAQQAARFEERTGDAIVALRDRMDAHVEALRAVRGLFAAGHEPTRDAYRAFVANLRMERSYPGAQGIGWAPALRGPEDEELVVERARQDGHADFRVWPEGSRPPRSAILYIEPLDFRNERALGFDMASEAVRRAAMERARDTGEPSCSGRVELVQEYGVERQPGFLVYVPVYDGAPASVAERGAALRGFVYAPFRAADLLRATLADAPLGAIALDVVDGEDGDARQTLYRSAGAAPAVPELERLARVEVAGRPWLLRFRATDAFETGWERVLPRAILSAGLALAAGLFLVVLREERRRMAAQAAARRASFLAEAGRILASSLDCRATLAEVARLAARSEADCCMVQLCEAEGPVLLTGHLDGARGRRAAERLARAALAEVERAGAGPCDGAALVHEVGPSLLRRIAAAPRRRAPAARRGSTLAVPLRARGETLGAIAFASVDARRCFGGADEALAQDLGRLAVAAIDTARLYARAQTAVRVRDEFLAIASHELRTPVTSLRLQAEGLCAARGAAPRKLEIIRRNADRLARLVTTLLDVSRIDADRIDLDVEEVDLAEVARDVSARFEEEAGRAGCQLRLELEPVRGRWDRLRLDQVVTNLVSNAVKYGAGRPVAIAVREREGRAVLDVSDGGIGIAPGDQDRIFGRFERAVSDRHYGGFGLGLWIVRRLVEALGGEVRVASEPGRGATFTVELPVAVAGLARDQGALGAEGG